MDNFIREIIWYIPPFLLAISVHESAHAWVAYKLGDPTARDEGRITLNPLPHIDVIGFILMLAMHFGWAKPVPVNPYNLKHPVRDNLWISLAGPASNLVLAVISAIVFRLAGPFFINYNAGIFVLTLIQISVTLNLVLMVFNLFPLPPLDGFHILEGLVSTETYIKLQQVYKYGPPILFAIVLISYFGRIPIFGMIFGPIVSILGGFLLGIPARW